MSSLLLHDKTRAQLAKLVTSAPNALLISGPVGVGKASVARKLACDVLDVTNLENHPYVLELSAEAGELGIEQIRALRQFTQRTTTGTGSIRRVCLLLDAGKMTSQAANALLKTLEEPPQDTMIVLTATAESDMPETIVSRVQTLQVLPVDQNAACTYFEAQHYPATNIVQAFRLSGGRPALMKALLDESDSHPLVAAIKQAKQLVAADAYERLTQVDGLSKDKELLNNVLFGLERIASSLLSLAGQHNDHAKARRAHKTQTAVASAQAALARSASVKLVLTDLFVNM